MIPQASRAAWIFGSANIRERPPPKPPLPLGRGLRLKEPLGRAEPERKPPDGVGIEIPAAARHSWIFWYWSELIARLPAPPVAEALVGAAAAPAEAPVLPQPDSKDKVATATSPTAPNRIDRATGR
jgi:hypothetical protein